MSGSDPFDDVSPERESLRAVLALVCIVAVIFAAAALPALTLAGPAGSEDVPLGEGSSQPAESATPGERNATTGGGDTGTPPSNARAGGGPSGDATGSQSGGGSSGGQTGDGDVGNQTSSGDTSGQSSGGDTGSQTGSSETGTQTGDGTSGGSSGGDTSGETSDGTSGETSDETSGETSDGTSGETSGGETSGDGGEIGNQTSSGDTSGETSTNQTSGDSDGEASGEQSGNETVPDQSDEQPDSYNISLNRSATAGAVVEVTVTRGGAPAAGVQVSFNGDPIGSTDEAGTVVGQVPYSSRLNITVTSGATQSLSAPPRHRGGRLFALASPRTAQVSNESFVVNTNVSLALSGPVVTGSNVTLIATVDGVPIRSAAVTVDGEQVGTTDDSGHLELRLPAEPGNYSIAVSRDAVSGERTVALAGLSVETAPTLPLALPGTGLELRVTAGGQPVPNATVTLGGDAVAETDGNGTATVTLPFSRRATVTVRQHGQVREQVVGGLLLNFAGVVAGALALVGGVGHLLRRHGVTRGTVAGWLRRLTQLAVNSLLWVVSAFDSALERLWARLVLTVAALRAFVSRRRTPAQLWAALRGWVVSRFASVRRSADAAATAARNADPRSEGVEPADDRTAIRAAWGRFLAHVSLGRTRTATPGEIAAHAIEVDDIPPEAVDTLREAYRAVEYGQYDPGEHVSAVESAIETIEQRADDDTGGDAAP